ncbi:MAG: hypothetical protein ACI89J_003080 [Hyphomicrobiaceae bacterium]|jgi:hypothetical protein
MLYHWYELDLEAVALSRASQCKPARANSAVIRYNATTAIAHAAGVPYRLVASEPTLNAANDRQADAIAVRLRKAGLGVIGERRQRAQPGDYTLMRQVAKLGRSTFKFIAACASDTIELVTQRHRHNVLGCSHTMVSNDTDDQATAGDDAQRQRSNVSIG